MKKYKKGITFGAFDPLHHGHIMLFVRAKEMCDELIVCISTGDYIKENKKRDERFGMSDRIKSLRQIRCIDKFCIQDIKFGKKEAVDLFEPDVIFVGSDWNKDTFKGEGLGIPVVYLKRTKGISSTKIK